MPKQKPSKHKTQRQTAPPAKAVKSAAKAKPSKPVSKPAPKAKPAPKSKPATKQTTKPTAPTQKTKESAQKNGQKPASQKKILENKGKAKAAPPSPAKTPAKQDARQLENANKERQGIFVPDNSDTGANLSPFLRKQREKLMYLRDNMLDSMSGVATDTLRSKAEGSEASAFGMHQADAGSDAYDRDFALSLLSKEQDALYEIEQALKRIEMGSYGVCEISNKPIAHARLEAIPFARYTVECQAQLEKLNKPSRNRVPVTSLFGLTEGEDSSDGDDDETSVDTKD